MSDDISRLREALTVAEVALTSSQSSLLDMYEAVAALQFTELEQMAADAASLSPAECAAILRHLQQRMESDRMYRMIFIQTLLRRCDIGIDAVRVAQQLETEAHDGG